MRTFLIILWGVDAFGALVRVEYFDSAQPQNAWVKVLVTDEGARVRAVCVYAVQDEAKADSQSAEFVSAVEDAQAWLPQCPDSVEVEGVTLVPVSTSVFSYDGNDSRLLQVSSDGSGSSLNYGAAGFVSSVASWGSAEDSAVSFSLLCASTDGRVLAAGGAPAAVPEFGVPSTGAGVGSVAGFDASVMHPLVWDENSFVPRVLGMGGSSLPSVGSLVPGAGSGAGLLDPYGWASLGVVAPAVPSAQGASATGGVPVLPDSLVGVSAASGVVLGSSGFEVLGARVVDSRVARFTAPDPLAAPVGAGWGADPFSLVGGNPVSLVDPWGLSPVSVEDFDKFREERIRDKWTNRIKGILTVVGVVASIAAIFVTGGTALVVLGAIAGGTMAAANAIDENKDPNTGKVDWGNVAKSGVIGGIFGAISGGMGKWANGAATKLFKGAANGTGRLLASTPTRVLKATGVRMTVEGIKGGVTSAVDGTKDLALNLATGGKHEYSLKEHATKVASSMAFSGLNSMISPVSGSLSKVASKHIPGVNEKALRKGIDVTANAVSSAGQSAFDSWSTGKEVRVEELVWNGITSAKNRYGDYEAPAGNVGDPSTLKQMGTRPYTVGTYLNSTSRAESTRKYFADEARNSVTSYADERLHINDSLEDLYDRYKESKGEQTPDTNAPNEPKQDNTNGKQTQSKQGRK